MNREFWNQQFFGNTMQDWVTALTVLAVSVLVILILKRLVVRRLEKWSKATDTSIDDFLISLVESSGIPLLYFAAIYFSLDILRLSPQVSKIARVAFLLAATFFSLRIITAFVRRFVFSFIKSHEDSDAKAKQARGLLIIVNAIIWIIGALFLVDNLGYDVTTLIAGLGIGGIAIALAAQTILGDLFSYFVIFFDRPFEIGDFIIIDDKLGTVEYIGVKTTRIRTLSGEQLICSNTWLTNAQVHNYKRMQERRVVFRLRVVYETSRAQLQRIPEIIHSIIEQHEDLRFDRAHLALFGEFSYEFETVYYVLSPDYNRFMDRQQGIYLSIIAAFEKEGISIAYPTQNLLLQRGAAN